jgi:hypothetical protein
MDPIVAYLGSLFLVIMSLVGMLMGAIGAHEAKLPEQKRKRFWRNILMITSIAVFLATITFLLMNSPMMPHNPHWYYWRFRP